MEKEASPVGIPHPPPPPPPFLVPPQTTTCRGLDSGVGRPGVCRLSPVLRSRLHRGHLKTPGLPWTVVDLAYGGGGGGWVGISSLEDRSTELVDLASPGHFVSRRPVLPGMASLLLALNLDPFLGRWQSSALLPRHGYKWRRMWGVGGGGESPVSEVSFSTVCSSKQVDEAVAGWGVAKIRKQR